MKYLAEIFNSIRSMRKKIQLPALVATVILGITSQAGLWLLLRELIVTLARKK